MLDPNKVHIGVAPIIWTNDDMPDIGGHIPFEQCVSEMALAGYEGCEIGNKFPKDVSTLRRALALRGLRICNSWFGCRFTTTDSVEIVAEFDQHTDFLRAVGADVVGPAEVGRTVHGDESIPLYANEPNLSVREVDQVAQGLNQLGRIARSKGLTLSYHYHAGTGIQYEDQVDLLMAKTDPDLVSLTLDTGHATLAGMDPVRLLRKHGHRVRHVHLKDVRSAPFERLKSESMSFLQGVRIGVFTVPGDGDLVDMEAVLRELDALNYQGWLVVEAEQDSNQADPLEYAMKARRFLRIATRI